MLRCGGEIRLLPTPEPLSAAVGLDQPNRPADVLLVQKLLNKLIADAGAIPLKPIPESSLYDAPTQYAIHAVELRYFYGVADARHRVEPDGDLFRFLVAFSEESWFLYKGPALSREAYGLAAKMVPAGADHILKKMMTEPGGHKTIQKKTVPGTIREHLPNVLRALTNKQLADADMIMMALATIRAETAGFRPIDEGQSEYNTSPKGTPHRHPFDMYDNRAKALGNLGEPDGASFKGRGFVQLTGRHNYTLIGAKIGVDLVNHPELGNDSETAAKILAQFLFDAERDVRIALEQGDLKKARQLVNGGLIVFRNSKQPIPMAALFYTPYSEKPSVNYDKPGRKGTS